MHKPLLFVGAALIMATYGAAVGWLVIYLAPHIQLFTPPLVLLLGTAGWFMGVTGALSMTGEWNAKGGTSDATQTEWAVLCAIALACTPVIPVLQLPYGPLYVLLAAPTAAMLLTASRAIYWRDKPMSETAANVTRFRG
jgi:hypothetical protein